MNHSPLVFHKNQFKSMCLFFLRTDYGKIIVFGLAGVVAAFIFLLVTPKLYEAKVQIVMAQFPAYLNPKDLATDSLRFNVEDPARTMLRLSMPTSYTAESINACGFSDARHPAQDLVNAVKTSLGKDSSSLELKVVGPSPRAAAICANEIFKIVKKAQGDTLESYIKALQFRLDDKESKLLSAQELMSRLDSATHYSGLAYILIREDISNIRREINAIKMLITSTYDSNAYLLAPIFASDVPIAPKKRSVLLAGLFGGLLLGLVVVLSVRLISEKSSEANADF